MAAEITYFNTSTSSAWYTAVKSYLDSVGIFDEVVINDSTYPLICRINNVDVFKFSSGNTGFSFYNTAGERVFSISDGNFNNPCYIAKTDDAVYISTNNGTSLREFIFGKGVGGDPYWLFWFSKQPDVNNNKPHAAYFDAFNYLSFNYISTTSDEYSRAAQSPAYKRNNLIKGIPIYQFLQRQSILPAINGGSTPYCYKVKIDNSYFITSGQFLMPYTE